MSGNSLLYLTLVAGPLRYSKKWFYNRNKYKMFSMENLKRLEFFKEQPSSPSSQSGSRFSFSLSSALLPAFISAKLAENFQYIKEHLSRFLPKVEAITLRDLVGRRKQYNFIADVAELAAPAVAYIEIRDTKRFDYYTGQPTPISNGSGFIIDSNGLVLTNAHVVVDNALRNNISILVKLLDGRSFEGKVESVDKVSDLATVRIKASNLPSLKLGTSGSLKAGEWVVALGSPLSLSNTVTSGIISAYRKSEELGLHQNKIVYLQTDASINQGNSGGPLMNIDGEAIGINSMKILPGISFAIPMDHAKKWLKQPAGGQYQQSSTRMRYAGLTMMTLSDSIIVELRRRNCSLSDKVREGVLIWKVLPNSPAEK